MTQIDDTFLTDLGLQNLPDDKKQKIVEQLQAELEERVGEKLIAGMSEEQMTDFEAIIDQDADTLQQWLETNRPDYPAVVEETLNEMKEELAHNRDVILGKA
jgi:hypothetical protein